MAERRWHIREKEGNPTEAGTYQVIVTFTFAGRQKAEMTERYLADLGEDGNGPGRFIAVLTLIERLAKKHGVSFDDLIVYLCQAHEEIELAKVADEEEGEADG